MRRVSKWLICMVAILLTIGIVMLASSSTGRAEARFGDPQYFLRRQLVWLALSFVGVAIAARCDYHWWQKRWFSITAAILIVGTLILVFVPPIGGARIGGSYRWLRLGPLSIQPSEFAKLGVLILLSGWMADVGRHAHTFRSGLLIPIAGLGVVLGLMILEPDFGTTALTGAVGMAIMFAGGTRISYLSVTGMGGACAFCLAILMNPVRLGRVVAFLMPEKHPATAHQLVQSKVAFVSGGWLGRGLGNSVQKQLYLPEAHTDFIFAIIGEELGLIATLLVICLFAGIMVCGIIISMRAPDRFGKLLAYGITMMITLQAAINIGVVTGCLPTKGIALPFISYGGTCLLVSCVSIGILLNIAHHAEDTFDDDHTRVIRNRARRI